MTRTIADHPVHDARDIHDTDGPARDGEDHARRMILARIAHDGLPALSLVLLAAGQGEPTAGAMPIGALLRAIPEVDLLTCHDLLRGAGLRDDQPVGTLTPHQRGSLAEALRWVPRPRPVT